MAKRATLEDLKSRLDAIDKDIYPLLEAPKEVFSFRVNLHKASVKEVLELLKKEGLEPKATIFEDSFTLPLEDKSKLTHTLAYSKNYIYIQNLSSIFAANALDINPTDWVLDLAAAPGGKSLIFSQKAKKVSAVEPNRSRFFAMIRNFKEMGAKNILTFNKDGRFVYKATPKWFDKVFLDAPCSSESHIDIKEGITWWSQRRIYKFAKLQKQLIISAFESLKDGGEMIYATCTFAPEENEAVLDFLLKKYPTAKIVPIEHNLSNIKGGISSWQGEEYSKEVENSLRILPKDGFSGFFLAKIVKDIN
ncbi:MAG: RsmB/NOP family class I SAM-dependent RNA methyltransferase [Epsilonproteobacteria bacterium]|nr:RsmB/NOP family class I SAM-dependent RNA methyltransferase [Campylobacterota bacterium]